VIGFTRLEARTRVVQVDVLISGALVWRVDASGTSHFPQDPHGTMGRCYERD
jgi:hypothetical protein